MNRYSSKPDANRAMVVAFFRAHGASWLDTRGPPGTPDGVLGYRGVDRWVEIKTAKGPLSDAQEALHATWRGAPITVVRGQQEAQALLEEMRLSAEVLRRAAG